MDKAGKWDVSVSDMKIGGVVCYSKGGNEFYAFEVKRERGGEVRKKDSMLTTGKTF